MRGASHFQRPTAVVQLSTSPDGALAGFLGQLAIDTTSGVLWRNEDGARRWEPASIPDGVGSIYWSHIMGFGDQPTFNNVGAGSSGNGNAETAVPGIRTFTVTAAGVDAVYAAVSANQNSVLFGGGRIWSKTLFRIPTLSDATNNIVVRLGMGDATTFADHTDGVYLEYDLATHGDHKWRLCTANNGTRTKTDTGILAVASSTTMSRALIMVNADGTSVTARVDGVAAAAAVTTNIPTGVGRTTGPVWPMALKQLGAGALTFTLDAVGFKQVLTNPATF